MLQHAKLSDNVCLSQTCYQNANSLCSAGRALRQNKEAAALGLLEGHAQQGPRDKDIEVLFIPSVHNAPAAMLGKMGAVIGSLVIGSCFGILKRREFSLDSDLSSLIWLAVTPACHCMSHRMGYDHAFAVHKDVQLSLKIALPNSRIFAS